MLYKVTTASGQEYISDTIVPVRLKGDTYIPPKQGQEADGFCAKIPVGEDEMLQDTVFVYEGHTMKGTEETATWEEVQEDREASSTLERLRESSLKRVRIR